MDEHDNLSLEKLRIHERLMELEKSHAEFKTKVETQSSRIVAHLESERGTWERYTESTHRIHERLSEIVNRHDMKITLLEKSEESREWNWKLVWGSIITLIVKLFWDLTGRGK